MSPVARAPRASVLRVLSGSRLFGSLDDESLRFVAAASSVSAVSEGEVVWRQATVATSFTVLHAGIVKLTRALPDGNVDIVALVGPREHLCVSAVLERAEYLATAQVVSERAEILRVDAAAVCERLEHDAGFADALGRVLLEQTRRQFEKIRVMSARSVTQRLATLLLVLDERFGVPDAEGVRIPVPLSRGDLAAFIGARVETTIRCIRRWERAGVLTTTSGGIVLRELAVIRAAVRAAPTGGDRSDDPARSA